MNENGEAGVVLRLSKDEALVLFEWLKKNDEHANGADTEESERVVLWRVEAQLEKALVAPLQSDYRLAVERARKRVIESATE